MGQSVSRAGSSCCGAGPGPTREPDTSDCKKTEAATFGCYQQCPLSISASTLPLNMGGINKHMLLFMGGLILETAAMDIKNGEGDILKDLPCVKRLNQLYCSSVGETYPGGQITTYIDDNKALLRRMYGELQEPRTITKTTVRVVRTFPPPSFIISPIHVVKPQFASPPKRFRRDVLEGTFEEMLEQEEEEKVEEGDKEWQKSGNATEGGRAKRQADFPGNPEEDNTKTDVCESKTEIVTPYWASNSNGKVRAVLNNKEFEQAVHQEICSVSSTLRCQRDCSCEQKYKWHRLLAYDPNNDCAGIFMDWFLYPSCCVCRCNKNPFLTG